MTNAKQLALKAIAELPDDCSWQDIADAFEFLPPWRRITPPKQQETRASEAELEREVMEGHPLFGQLCSLIARRQDCDDVLFAIGNPPAKYAVVHLTWRGGPERSSNFPSTEIFSSFKDFVERRMLSDAADFEGDCLEEDYQRYRAQG